MHVHMCTMHACLAIEYTMCLCRWLFKQAIKPHRDDSFPPTPSLAHSPSYIMLFINKTKTFTLCCGVILPSHIFPVPLLPFS